MSKFLSLLLSFEGRIPSSRFWLGFIVTSVLTALVSYPLNPAAYNGEDHVTVADTTWQLLMLTPLTALTIKRFNDRNWPWWFGYVPNGLVAVGIIANHFGYLSEPERFSAIEWVFVWTACPAVLLALADNGLLKGTNGPNRYGPDPLQGLDQSSS